MGVLLMLITIGAAFAAGIGLGIAIYTRRLWLRSFVIGATAVWFFFYLTLLIGISITSEEKQLGLNEPKEFCGFYLDCHLHTAVSHVRRARTIGNKTADGEFYIVTVKVFSNAKKATLGFDTLKLFVKDADGRSYPHSPEVESPDEWFTRPVPAGGSFERDVVFDLPVDVKQPLLDIRDGKGLIEKFLIGDEDSLFHKRAYFKLSVSPETVAVR